MKVALYLRLRLRVGILVGHGARHAGGSILIRLIRLLVLVLLPGC